MQFIDNVNFNVAHFEPGKSIKMHAASRYNSVYQKKNISSGCFFINYSTLVAGMHRYLVNKILQKIINS